MMQHNCPGSSEEMKRRKQDKKHDDSCSCRNLLKGVETADVIAVFTNHPDPVEGIFLDVKDGVLRVLVDQTLVNICCNKINYIVRGEAEEPEIC